MDASSKQRCIHFKYEIGPISGTCSKTGYQCTGNPEVCKEEIIEISNEQLELEQRSSNEWALLIKSQQFQYGFATQIDNYDLQREILKLRLEMQLMEIRIIDFIKNSKKEK